MTRGARTALTSAALFMVAAAPAQRVQELPLLTPVIARVYERGADGLELYHIRSVAIEPSSGALWVQMGEESEPPFRVDRKTGAVKVVGRKGSGPDEYARIIIMVSGAARDVGIWDPSRRLWFWVDSSGHQVRTWPLPTNSLDYGGVFSDVRGNVYLRQPATLSGNFDDRVIVRLDSARGLIDTTRFALRGDDRWSYNARSANGTSGTRVPFAPYVLSGVDRLGRVYSAWTDSSFLIVGNMRRRLPDYREPLDAADRQRATEQLDKFEERARAQGRMLSARPPIPATRPQIIGIVPELNGGIAIVRSRSCAAVQQWKWPGNAADMKGVLRCPVVERFDADGRPLSPFSIAPGDQLVAMRADTAWVTRENADGLARIVEYTIAQR